MMCVVLELPPRRHLLRRRVPDLNFRLRLEISFADVQSMYHLHAKYNQTMQVEVS